MQEQYDYVIVGAGSSGCVLANRLSADPSVSVLLVESGPADTDPMIRMPRGIGKLLVAGNKHVWDYQIDPGSGAPQELWLKGRTLGGSSSINGMVYVRGAPADYDAWEAAGCTGWGWRDIGRQFVALEDHQLGAAEYRGAGGPLKVSIHPSGSPLCEAVIKAAQQSGTPRVEDTNHVATVESGAFGYQPQTTWKGQRFSAARAFLEPIKGRTNLEILTGTHVLKINFIGTRATSLIVREACGTREIGIGREVILSAGAIESPKLLQLSGVGPAALLRKHGIDVVAHRSQVGQNLREHVCLPLQYRVRSGSLNHAFRGLGLLRSLWCYYTGGRGPLSHAAHEAGGFVRTRPDVSRADAQIGVSLHSLTVAKNNQVAPEKEHGLTFYSYFTRPESQGEVAIRSADPADAPVIKANYMSTQVDRDAAVALVRWVRNLVRQPALAPFVVEELVPGPQYRSDEELLEAVRRIGRTAYHVSGTCRMGSDADSVLDPELRVRGVSGVRVVDTSIMPTLVSGNTNAPAMAIAMRASELILESNQHKSLGMAPAHQTTCILNSHKLEGQQQ